MIVLCGTNRPEANSRKIAKHIFDLLSARYASSPLDQKLGPLLYMDLADLQQDIFEPSNYAAKPQWFTTKFQAPILAAKGLIVITPEYNGSFPGVLKYFVDMLKFPESLVGLPVAFVGVAAGVFGALRSVEQLTTIFQYRNANVFGEKIYIPKVNEVIKPDGSIGAHEERLKTLVNNFTNFCDRLASK